MDPPLKMAWVERGNPVTQNPDTETVLEAFRALEFRVVVEQIVKRRIRRVYFERQTEAASVESSEEADE